MWFKPFELSLLNLFLAETAEQWFCGLLGFLIVAGVAGLVYSLVKE